MDRTEAVLRKFFSALPCPAYDLGILHERGMYRMEAVPVLRILRMLPYLKRRNANGAHIYGRPTGESAYTLLDDADSKTLTRLAAEGFAPAAVVETSPCNFQAWLRHQGPLSKELGTLAAKMLAEHFSTDRNAADWRRFGRLPGFTNRKAKYRNASGLLPFVQLHQHGGEVFAAAESFGAEVLAAQAQAEQGDQKRRIVSQARRVSLAPNLSLTRFRDAPQFQDRPAAADLAFSIFALAHGWSETGIADALRANYLSRDNDTRRPAAYLRRTLAKAQRRLA